MSRSIGQEGLELIKKFEGCRLVAYRCAAGVWTIGYGHTSGVKQGQTCTQKQAEKWLKEDCQKFADFVDNPSYVPVTSQLNDNQRDALISFAYNCGQNNLKTLCAGRDITAIGNAIPKYNKAGGRVLQGLVRRRQAERNMFLNGSSGTVVNINGGSSNIQDTRVLELQRLCNAILHLNIAEDNIWGQETENAVRQLPLCGIPYTQRELTKWVQLRLGISPDGIFLYETANAVRQWQRSHGLVVDEIVGYNTYKSLALD